MSSHPGRASAQGTTRIQSLSELPQSNTLLAPHLPRPIASIDDIKARLSERRAKVTQRLKTDRSSRSYQAHHTKRQAEPSSTDAAYAPFVADRIILSLLEKIKKILPVYTGLTLDDLSNDTTTLATIQLFCSFATQSRTSQSTQPSVSDPSSSALNTPNPVKPHPKNGMTLIARGLCDLIECVNQVHALPIQILHSQIFLLQILLRFLAVPISESPVPTLDPAPSPPTLIPNISAYTVKPRSSLHSPSSLFDVVTTSRILSVLFTFIPSLNGDLDLPGYRSVTPPPLSRSSPHTYATAIPSSSSILSSHSNQQQKPPQSPKSPKVPNFTPFQLPNSVHLTSLPPIPLHGFETFAPPALHIDGAGILCPKAVWEHSTNPQLHPTVTTRPHPEDTSAGSTGVILPYTSLYTHLDVYPPTLSFLPPSMVLGRYAARCVYFLSKSECTGEDQVGDTAGGERGQGRSEKNSNEVVWDRITSGVRRLAGVTRRASVGTGDNERGGGKLVTNANGGGLAGVEREDDKDRRKLTPRASQTSSLFDFGSKMPRRSTMVGAVGTLPGVNESGEAKNVEPRSGEDSKLQLQPHPRAVGDVPWLGEEDVTELSLLGFVAMRKDKLSSVMIQLASLLVNMSSSARGAAAAAIRAGIFAWFEDAPAEFVRLAGGNSSVYRVGASDTREGKANEAYRIHPSVERIEGAERLLDLMTSLVKDDYSNIDLQNDYVVAGSSFHGGAGQQARALLWTGVGALFCVCTNRLRGADIDRGNSLLTTMARYMRSPGPNADIALRFYSDVCRAAFFIPPYEWKIGGEQGRAGEGYGAHAYGEDAATRDEDVGEPPLRVVASEAVDELVSFLEHYPPYKLHGIDPYLYADALVAVYRFLPHRAVDLIHGWLAPKCGDAVKLCVVQAALRLVVEAQAFPWQPALDAFVKCCSQPMNVILRGLLYDADDGASPQPVSIFPSLPDRRTLRRTLLLSLQGLLRLDLAFAFCGPSTTDLAEVSRVGVKILGPHRDSGVLTMNFAMYAAWIAGARIVCRESAGLHHNDKVANGKNITLYKEARAYLRANIYTTLFAFAQQLLDVWSYEKNLLCVLGVKYILGILTDGSQDGEDTSWRYAEGRFPTLAMTEMALNPSCKSGQLTVLRAAFACYPLLAQAYLDSNAPAPPIYFARAANDTSFRATLTSIATVKPLSLAHGKVAVQKRVRDDMTEHSIPSPMHLAGWRECYFRWKTLCPLVRAPESAAKLKSGLVLGPVTMKECRTEWTNYGLALARGAVYDAEVDPSLFKILGSNIPDRMLLHQQPKKLMYQFVHDMLEMLNADTPDLRDIAKLALGKELHQEAIPKLSEQLNRVISKLVKNVDVSVLPEIDVLFLNNCVGVLSLLVDRAHNNAKLVCDVGPILLPLSHFLNLRTTTTSDLRARTQFCGIIQMILEWGDIFNLLDDSGNRQILLDITIGWTSVPSPPLSPEDQPTTEYVSLLHSCQIASLQTASELAHNLRLEPVEKTTKMDFQNVVSRIFHRYITAFVKGLDLQKAEGFVCTKTDSMSTSQPITTLIEKHVQESVIVGITNLINANTDIGLKQCLWFGYDEDPGLRVTFMEVFSRVLKCGTKFDTRHNLNLVSKDTQLCETIRKSEFLVDCMVNVCATSEIDSLTSVLLNIFDTRQAILALAQRLISREINEAGSPTVFFRENTLTNHVLSEIAKQYGYRYLRTVLEPIIKQTLHELEDTSLELDPARLQPGEDLQTNHRLVLDLAQSLLDGIIASAPQLPSIIIDICHYIFTMIIKSYPDARYSALGGFLFLRFFCPAITSPESIDIEPPVQDSQTKTNLHRVLVVLAKILQTLSNNFMFGKEVHLVFLNPFLDSNIASVARFFEKAFFVKQTESREDQWLGLTYDDTDAMILHQFFHRHHDDIGKVLLSGAGPSVNEDPVLRESTTIWRQVCDIRAGLDPVIDFTSPSVAPLDDIAQFEQYLMKNAHRNRDAVRHIFYQCEDRPNVFVLRRQALNVETVDIQLLKYHIFCSLKEHFISPIDGVFVFDYTKSKPTAEFPLDWLKDCLEAIPAAMRNRIQALYILNANASTQRFYQKFFLVCSESYLAREVHAVSSVSELFKHIGHVEGISKSPTGLLEAEPSQVFKNVYQRYVHHQGSAVTLEVRRSHLRIISLKPRDITPHMHCRTVEIISLEEVDDIYRIASEPDTDLPEFVISRGNHGTAMQFGSHERNTIVQAITAAKSRVDLSGPHTFHGFSGLSDITATLLAIGFINLCHEEDCVRDAASMLLKAICSYHKYDKVSATLPAMSTSYILNSPTALVLFSEQLSLFAPHLTLDFLIEFRQGFLKASIGQKMESLSYLPPWIRNIPRFATPGDVLYDQSGGKLRNAIHSLCDISLGDKAIYQRTKEFIWIELTKMEIFDSLTLSIVVDELIRLAVDSGIDSLRCHLIVDVIMTLSCIQVRAHTLNRLRQALRKKTLSKVTSDADNAFWSEVSTLSRLALGASHNPKGPTQNHLFISEIVHVITMVAAAGPLKMRKSIYGLFSNLIHSLLDSRNSQEKDTPEYYEMVTYLTDPATAHLFGLSPGDSCMAYAIRENPPQHHLDFMAVEELSEILLKVIEGGVGNEGFANVLKARWMSLVIETAFQSFQYMQARAFTVVGVLIKDNINNDLLYQILLSLKVAIQRSPDGNCVAVVSMLRCLHKLIPGMNDSPSYLCSIFWMAVAFLQAGHVPYYVWSMHLIRAVLEKLETQSALEEKNITSMLLQARSTLANEVEDFDNISGFSFIDELSFSLSMAFLLYSVASHPTFRPIAGEVLRAFLRIVSRSRPLGPGIRMVTREVDPSLIGFLLGSLPFSTNVASLRALLEDARVDVPWWESRGLFNGRIHQGYECAVPFSLLGVSDARSARLIIGFITSMLELHPGDSEQEILYCLLADAVDHYPSMVSQAQAHFLTWASGSEIAVQIIRAYSGSHTLHGLLEGRKLALSALTSEEQWTPNRSSSTLSTLSYDDTSPTNHYLGLEKLGMSGLATHLLFGREDTQEDFATLSPLFENLIERILEA